MGGSGRVAEPGRVAGSPRVPTSRRAAGFRRVAGGISALVVGGLVLAMEIWTVVPAPNLASMVLAVSIPEVTPWAVIACVLAGVVAQVAARGWSRTVGLGCAAVALGLALIPWCLLPATVARCDHDFAAAFGAGSAAPGALRRPYDVGLALGGYRRPGPFRVRHDLPVPLRDGGRLALDLYTPLAGGPHPTVIIIYGGAWIFGSRAASAEIATSLTQLGYTAIAVDYRHAPFYEFPTQIDDIRDALASIARNANAYSVDPRRVAIFGRSAGAELALLAAYDPGPLPIRAVVAYYAPTDLIRGYRFPPQPDPAHVDGILRAYIGGAPEQRMASYVAASPLAHVRPGLPPTLLINGDRDELVRPEFATGLRAALLDRRDRVAALDIPWSNHAFDSIPNGTGGQLARYYTQRFLATTL